MGMKQDVHDRLWQAFQRWQAKREAGETKHELKTRGLRECGDPNRHTRDLIFSGATLRSYEGVLKDFVEHAQTEHGAKCLEDVGKKDFRSYMDRAIERGLAVKTLNRFRSALAKFGALCRLPPYVYFPLDLDHPPMYPCGFSSSSGGLE